MSWRHDPLTHRTVRLAAERARRPNDFAEEPATRRCPFCAGAEGDTPPELDREPDGVGGWFTRVVPNRFPIVDGDDGAHEVIIESPRHVVRFVDLTDAEAAAAVRTWFRRIAHHLAESVGDGSRGSEVVWFKNEGPAAGASLEHVHSQLVAMPKRPAAAIPRVKLTAAAAPDALAVERDALWTVAAAYAPRFACEAWLAPSDPELTIDRLAQDPVVAGELSVTLRRLINAARRATGQPSFNLTMPLDAATGAWRLELTPRVSQIAGFELSTGLWINAVSPERAAESLRQALAAGAG